MTRSYPNSEPLQTENSLRERVAALMVAVHLITPELADHHVSTIDESELVRLLEMYARLGVAPRGFP